MSCNHLHDCPRCGGVVEELSHALESAIGIIEGEHGTPKLQDLKYVLEQYGMFIDE